MACALSKSARLLKYRSRHVMVNLRYSSSESKYGKSNSNFTSFTTKNNFQDFEKTPNLKVIASIIIYGASVPPQANLFDSKASDLIEGSLHAVEAVTQAISNDTETEEVASDLTSQLTNNCNSYLDHALLSKPIPLEPIGIDKEDIFFAWLGKYDQNNTKMTICTLSFPAYHYSRQKVNRLKQDRDDFLNEQTEAVKEGRLNPDHMKSFGVLNQEITSDNKEYMEHLNSNDIIVSNWDFVQEEGDWKIDGISMKKLKECIMGPFYWRWQLRVKFAVATNYDFARRVLRYDYGTDYLLVLIMINSLMLTTFAGITA